MKKFPSYIKNCCTMLIVLTFSFLISLVFQNIFEVQEHITTVFVFAVFLISIWTEGYLYGILSAIFSVLMVNFAFTFPYFAFNFTIPVNLISAIIMIVISVLTCTLTTKIKNHEAVKAESEKERMRANLLRAVSHDLRTPLTTIYGSSSTLLENKDTLSEDQRDKMLQSIKEEADWLVRIVENLLSITKIDNGRIKIIKTPTVLEELLDSVIIKFRKRYPEQKVELDIPDDIIIIPMDAILIEQVIVNILENAVRHAENMTRLSLRVYPLGKQAVFEIEDNGCGIQEERLPYIFSGCYDNTDEPSDGKKQNSGIGLSVCATIIKAHGGDISAENLKSGGTVFRFTLLTEEAENDK